MIVLTITSSIPVSAPSSFFGLSPQNPVQCKNDSHDEFAYAHNHHWRTPYFFNFPMVVDSCLVFAVEDGCSSDSSWFVVVWLGDSEDLWAKRPTQRGGTENGDEAWNQEFGDYINTFSSSKCRQRNRSIIVIFSLHHQPTTQPTSTTCNTRHKATTLELSLLPPPLSIRRQPAKPASHSPTVGHLPIIFALARSADE